MCKSRVRVLLYYYITYIKYIKYNILIKSIRVLVFFMSHTNLSQ